MLSLQAHHFVPGFPAMAWPMREGVRDTRYAGGFEQEALAEVSIIVRGWPRPD